MAGRDKAAEQLKEFKKTQVVSQGTHPSVIPLMSYLQCSSLLTCQRQHATFVLSSSDSIDSLHHIYIRLRDVIYKFTYDDMLYFHVRSKVPMN